MTFKILTLAVIGLGLSSLLASCKDADKDTVDGIKAPICEFAVPKKMRQLKKTYNEEFSAADSDGNTVSYETCKGQVQAARKYKTALGELHEWININCAWNKKLTGNQIVIDNYEKIFKLHNSLDRDIYQTNCESLFNK